MAIIRPKNVLVTNLSGTLTNTQLPTLDYSKVPVGAVLQVVNGRNGDFFSTNSTAWTDITNMSVTLTPKFASSKFVITIAFGRCSTSATNLDYTATIRVLRNGSDDVGINGNVSGGRNRVALNVNGWSYNADHSPGGLGVSGFDSPATTSPLTYKVQVACQSTSYPFSMNGAVNNIDSGTTYHSRSQSSITVWEIKQ
jgi:hypothetical protein